MSDSANRLEMEFAEVTRCFADHPQISIVSTAGSPVNQYVIEYRLNGLVQLDDDEIVQSDQHRIEINLSFGFPHFPPNCKPLTKIFHPDIDPSAIKIAEFWVDATSLTELILHIGKMICWQSYSAQDGFNQQALEWLNENQDAVPMDHLQTDAADVDSSSESADVALDLGLSSDVPELALDLGDDEGKGDSSGSSFVDDLDFNFSSSAESKGDTDTPNDPSVQLDQEVPQDLDFSLNEGEGTDLDLGLESATGGEPDSSLVGDLDFNTSFSTPSDEVELGDLSSDDSAPLELSLENDNIEPVGKESFSFVAAGNDEEDSSIVLEDVALEESDLTPSFPDEESGDVDLDLSVVDVDYDIFKGMIDQRNYFAAQTKFSAMDEGNISKASAILRPMVSQRIEQADAIHKQARKLEDEGLLEDAAKKLEAVMNLVQDYPNLEEDMKRVRDAWAGVSSPSSAAGNLGLDRAEEIYTEPVEAPVHDAMLSKTVVPPAMDERASSVVKEPKKKSKKKTKKKPKKDSFIKQKQNKPIIFAAFGLLLALCLSGWVFVEWQAFSEADQKWGEINSLLEKNEYQKVKEECLEIRALLSKVNIIMGGGKKELLVRVDDLLSSEHFLEGFEGKILWQGQYISKRAYRAYGDINDLVEEAERRGALSKWQESAELYERAFKIAQKNKKRLSVKFYDELALNVKNAKFANFVSQGKKYFIGTQWPEAIGKFEAALELAREDGVADPSISYDVNRYLQRAWFSQYVIDGDEALKANDFKTSFEKFTKAHDIASDPNLIAEANRQQVFVKLNQSSLIKVMDEAERHVADQQWKAAVASFQQAKQYTMDGYPLVGMDVVQSQRHVEGLVISSLVKMEREITMRKRAASQYGAAEAALGRIVAAIDQSSLKDEPAVQKIKRQALIDKNAIHLKAIVDGKIAYLEENYRQIVTENFTGVSLKALSNVHIEFLGQEERTLQFKIQCREQRESKYYTLELIYQYDIDLDVWGFPSM